MSLLEKISGYYQKADSFVLERHIEVANWANYNFGKSNYELSTYSAFLPVPLFFANYAYRAAASGSPNLLGASIALAAPMIFAYGIFKQNQELERREQIGLENLVKDYRVSTAKDAAKFWGPIFFAIASLYIPSYIYNVINGAPLGPKLVDLSLSALFFGLGAAVYFRRVDHKPKKKGRVPEAIKEAASKLLKRPVAEPSAA